MKYVYVFGQMQSDCGKPELITAKHDFYEAYQ